MPSIFDDDFDDYGDIESDYGDFPEPDDEPQDEEQGDLTDFFMEDQHLDGMYEE